MGAAAAAGTTVVGIGMMPPRRGACPSAAAAAAAGCLSVAAAAAGCVPAAAGWVAGRAGCGVRGAAGVGGGPCRALHPARSSHRGEAGGDGRRCEARVGTTTESACGKSHGTLVST